MEVPGPGEGSFAQIVSMIKPFSLQLDSLWRLYGLRKWDNANI